MWICPECRQIYETNVERCERDDAPVAEVYAHQTKARYPFLGRIVGDRYHLIGGLGQGGLGTVYLAQHRHLGQLFAVKFLELQSLGAGSELDDQQKSGYRRDFLKEAQVASLVRHPSVVRVTDFGEHDGLPFLVMEYVPGPSLLQMLGSRGRFAVPETVAIGRRIAEALDAFHERRLVHRDLKPANVILDPRGDGRLTLVDLGLVKDLSNIGARASTHPLALRGTPGYLAPEQVPAWVLAQQGVRSVNEKRVVDARVDLYALGVIFYEMLTGVSPYPDGSNTAVIVYACTRDPIPFSTIEPPVRVPAALEALVLETMHRDPERRPSSAAAFLERLDGLTMGQAVQGSWPAIIAPGVRGRSAEPQSGPAGAAGPIADPLASLGRLVPSASPDDGDEGMESTAVFTDVDLAASSNSAGSRPGESGTGGSASGREPPSASVPANGAESAGGGGPSSAGRPANGASSSTGKTDAARERLRAASSAALELRATAAASPDRTLEADVLDPDALEPDALGPDALDSSARARDGFARDGRAPDELARDGRGQDGLGRDLHSPELDGNQTVAVRARPGLTPGEPGARAGARKLEDADFESESRTEVERVSPGLRSPPSGLVSPPAAAPVAPPVSVPREVPRAESVRRPAPGRRSPWRVPVAVGLVGAAAATGWIFARQQDTTPDASGRPVVAVSDGPAVHVVRIGSGDAGPPPGNPPPIEAAPTISAEPSALPATVPGLPTGAPAANTAGSTSAPATSAPVAGVEPTVRRKPPPGGIEQLLTEGDAALSAGKYKTALERYEAFMKRAGEGHPKYWEIQPRVEKLREKLQRP